MKLKPLPWPKLSEQAAHPKTPEACQCCGSSCDVTVYIECDEADRETAIAIAVCDDCAKAHVEPHPRYYRELERNRAFPGAMFICVECSHRDGMRCTHHDLKANGGDGLMIRSAKGVPCFFDGSKDITGVVMDYGLAPPVCSGRPLADDEVRAPHFKLSASLHPEVAQ